MDMCYDGVLVMPSDYLVIEEEEMRYVEGGFNKKGVNKSLAGLTVYFDAKQTNTLIYCYGNAAIASQVLHLFPSIGNVAATVIGITLAFTSGTLAWMNSDGSGVKVFMPWAAINPFCPVKGVLSDQKWNIW